MQPSNVQSLLVLGENYEFTLFKIAISFAENGFNVWYISPQTFENIPKDMKIPDKEILQLITFLYLKDHNDLISHLNGIHLWRKHPDVIILTQFEHYCNFSSTEYNPLQAALVATSLLDSAAVCAAKKNRKNNLLIASAIPVESDKNRLQTIADLYFSNVICKTENNDFIPDVLKVLN